MTNPVRNSSLSPLFVIVLSSILAAMFELKLYRLFFRYLSFLDKFCELKEMCLGLVSVMLILILLIHTLKKGKGTAPWTTLESLLLLSICILIFGDWSDLLTIVECAHSGDAGTSSHVPPNLSSTGVTQLPEGDEAGPSSVPPANAVASREGAASPADSSSAPSALGQPSNSGPREYNSPWKSFPSVPSDLPPLPAGSVPSVPSLPSVGSDFEVEQPAPIQPQDDTNVQQAPARHDPAPCEDPLWIFQHQRIKDRIATKTPERDVDDDYVDSIIMLKRGIIDRMAQLDPHPFWAEQKNQLIADGILHNNAEYTMEALERNLSKLNKEDGANTPFFRKLLRTRLP